MDEKYMRLALREAEKAYSKQEVPVGAVIVKDDQVIAKAYNCRERKKQACAHAEILAIEKACQKLDAWRLENCDIYVTLEPCAMCAGAILNAKMRHVYIGAREPRSGAVGSKVNLFSDYRYNHEVDFEVGILEKECKELMQKFFRERRK